MTRDPEDKTPGGDEKDVVDRLLGELGVDDKMKQDLLESGRLSGDIFKVESADQVRRRIEIEKSSDQLRDNLNMVERNLAILDSSIDKIERDLIPVVLSFLVGLKGNLVNMREDIVTRSRKAAKTNLQINYLDKEIKPIVTDEFQATEETLASGMSTPILDKIRDITESLKQVLKLSYEELGNLKASVDDYIQRTATEVEFMATKLSMKPKIEIPKVTQEKINVMERRIEELDRDLTLTTQKLDNREKQIASLQGLLEAEHEKVLTLEETVAKLKSSPTVDTNLIADLRQQLKSTEASRELLEDKLAEERQRAENAEDKAKEKMSEISRLELELEDARTKLQALNDEIEKSDSRLAEIDTLKDRLRSFESGDKARELDRVTSELERTAANLERTLKQHEAMSKELHFAKARLDGYMELMKSTEKTKAFMMVEEAGELSLKELRQSLGISPAVVNQWAQDFERIGIAEIQDDKLILTIGKSTPAGSKEN